MISLRSFVLSSVFSICLTWGQLNSTDTGAVWDILHSTFPDQWKPHGVPDRNDLRCSEEMMNCRIFSNLEKDDCCKCNAEPIWMGLERSLAIEYNSILGHAVVLNEFEVNISEVYQIEHRNAELTKLPVNLCNEEGLIPVNSLPEEKMLVNISQFQNRIVKIDVTGNKILEINNINCLKALDTLDVSYNFVQHLSNQSFTLLTHLRVLRLNNNQIKTMDINIISAPTMHLSRLDISENKLQQLDISNIAAENTFCGLDYSKNIIQEMTNLQNISLSTNKTYNGGMVHLSGNSFTTFPDFKQLLHMETIAQIGSLLNFGFDFRDAKIGCDCILEPLMQKAKDYVKMLWRDYFDVKCDSPKHLKGVPWVNVSLDDLICNLTPAQGCPVQCSCKDIPSQDTLFVDCSNGGLNRFPDKLPESKYTGKINLNLTENLITTVGNVSYLGKISNLNLSHNHLVEIDEETAKLLENAEIDISDNKKLALLPRSMQFRSMCSVHIDNLVLDCNCDSKWMENWMNVKGCQTKNNFTCRVPGHGLMSAMEFNSNILDCSPKDVFLVMVSLTVGSTLTALIVLGALAYCFRYETLIILLQMRQKKTTAIQPTFDYDAFFSYDTENEDLRKWVNGTLLTTLEQKGYTIFLPDRDLTFGDVRAAATVNMLQATRNFVLILSESYFDQEEQILTNNEWKYGWHMFLTNCLHNIVVINYDHMSSFDVANPQIRAFLRVGGQVHFVNRERDIIKQIIQKLGPKCSTNKQQFKQDNNKKTKLNTLHLFQVQPNINNKVGVHDDANGNGVTHINKGTASILHHDMADMHRHLLETFSEKQDHSNCKTIKSPKQEKSTADPTIQALNGLPFNSVVAVTEKQRPAHGLHHYWQKKAQSSV